MEGEGEDGGGLKEGIDFKKADLFFVIFIRFQEIEHELRYPR